MRRTLKIFLGLILISLLATGIGWICLFHTGPGKNFVETRIKLSLERLAQNRFGSELRISEISGNLPSHLIATDIELLTDERTWLHIGELKLDWSPFGLARNRFLIDSLEISNAELLTHPPERPTQNTKGSLPGLILPWIEVGQFNLDSLVIAPDIIGPEREIFAAGAFAVADRRLLSDVSITTKNETDRITALISGVDDRLVVNLDIRSQRGGILTQVLKSDTAIAASVIGNAPLSDWRGNISLVGGDYGTADFDFFGDLATSQKTQLTGHATLGKTFSPALQRATGEHFSFDLQTEKNRKTHTLKINRLEGTFGNLAGTIPGIRTIAKINGENTALTLNLNEEYASNQNISFLAGEHFAAGTLRRKNGVWLIDGTVEMPVGTLQVSEMKRDRKNGLVTDLDLRLDPLTFSQQNLTTLLVDGLDATAKVTFANGNIALANLSAVTPEPGLFVQTDISYDTRRKNLTAKGNLNLSPATVSLLTKFLSFDEQISSSFTIEGVISDLKSTVTSSYGKGKIRNVPFSAGTLEATLTGLPLQAQADLALTAADDTYSASTLLGLTEDKTLIARDISLQTGNITTAGTVLFNFDKQNISTDLKIRVDELKTSTDDLFSAGTIDIGLRANLVEQATQPMKLTVTADKVITRNFATERLLLIANGNLSRLDIDLDGENLQFLGRVPLASLTSKALLSQREAETSLTILSASAKAAAEDPESIVSLAGPARLVHTEKTTKLSTTEFNLPDDAKLALAGEISPSRWKLQAEGTKIQLPFLRTPLTMFARFDTDASMPGRIQLGGTLSDQNEHTHELRSVTLWDGRTFGTRALLIRDGLTQSGSFNLTLPLLLQRDNQLTVSAGTKSLTGQLQYDDDLESFLAFLDIDEATIEGMMKADVTIGGTLANPALTGQMALADGRWEESRTGALVTNLAGDLTFSLINSGSSGRFSITGSDAIGTENAINLAGEIQLGGQLGNAVSSIDGKLQLTNATLIKSPTLTMQANSDLALSGSLTQMLLKGSADILKLDAAIPKTEQKKSYIPVDVIRTDQDERFIKKLQTRQNRKPLSLALDLAIKADDSILISGRGLTSQWKADLAVTGTSRDPALTGTIDALDGTFDFAGRRFDINKGALRFTGDDALVPALDISADYLASVDGSTITTSIGITGLATNPAIALSSVPSLPGDEVLALVLFGKAPSELCAVESLRIAGALASLAGTTPVGVADFGDTLRRTIGLDLLSFSQDAVSGLNTLTIGKYISNDIYISTAQGVGEESSSVTITYDVTDNISVESKIEQEGAQSISANYKRDY